MTGDVAETLQKWAGNHAVTLETLKRNTFDHIGKTF